MKTTIVCGMLGAGKTTFIRGFVQTVQGKAVVLVNDFGKAGIDGEIFSAGGIESIELPSGCVCCTLKFDLITTIEKIIRTFSPEHLLIEPSGVASPSGVLEALESLKIHPVTVIGIIDATEFLELHESGMFGRFFEDQVRNSDILLVNKTDLADEALVSKTVSALEGINPGAIIYRTVNAHMAGPLTPAPSSPKVIDRHAPHLHFETLSFALSEGVDLESVSSLFHDLTRGKYGDIVRAKALVNTLQGPYQFDLSFSNVQAVPFGSPVSGSRLVLIGSGIRGDLLEEGGLCRV